MRLASSEMNGGWIRRRLWWRFLGHGSGNRCARRPANRGDHVAHHFHRVVLDDAQVLDAGILDPAQQRTHARVEHLHAQEVVARTRQRDLLGGLAHAETDLQHRRRLAAERGGRVQGARRRAGPLAQQLLQRGQLALRDMAAAMHEAADVGGAGAVGRARRWPARLRSAGKPGRASRGCRVLRVFTGRFAKLFVVIGGIVVAGRGPSAVER